MRGNLPRSKKQRKTVRVSLSLCLYFSNQGSATEQQITARKDTTFFFQARHNISLLLQRWGLFLIVTDRRNSQAEVEEKRISGTFNGHSVIHVYTRLYLHDRFEVWEWKLICHQHRQRDRLNYLHIFPAFISTTIILSDNSPKEKTSPITHLYKHCMWMRIVDSLFYMVNDPTLKI